MKRFLPEYAARFDEKVKCDGCGKEMRLGQCISNIPGHVCRACAESGYRGKQRKGR